MHRASVAILRCAEYDFEKLKNVFGRAQISKGSFALEIGRGDYQMHSCSSLFPRHIIGTKVIVTATGISPNGKKSSK